MSKQAKPTRTCAECFHCQACHMWSNGAISSTVAAKCPQFEPARYSSLKELQDLYKMHKGEVAPVRHASWNGGEIGRCTACGHEGCASDIWNGISINFCPNCGARMDAKEVNHG